MGGADMKSSRNILYTASVMLRKSVLFFLLGIAMTASAQEVSTLYFLENAPMRHQINPAFQPVSKGYVLFSPLGYTSMWVGNNSLTMSNVILNHNGQTVTALHPDLKRSALMGAIRQSTLLDMSMTVSLVDFGFRHKEKGYVYIGIHERVEGGFSLAKGFSEFLLDGGMRNLEGNNSFNLKSTGMQMSLYTEISGGYSYKINDQWTVGGKLKFLIGQAYANWTNSKLSLEAAPDGWRLVGNGSVNVVAPLNMKALPAYMTYDNIVGNDWNKLTQGLGIMDYVKPQGYGAAIDLGFTYKPHPQVQITAALNDLGFIVWSKGNHYNMNVDSTFTGIHNLQYSDYLDANNKFDANSLKDDVLKELESFASSLKSDMATSGFTRMLNARLNVGVDANFCNNKLGVGIVSKTRLFNGRLYEEVTLGGAVRPCNWFNLALSYSLVQNGRYSNFGAGLSFMPYDGINMTLAMDYIPTSFAYVNNNMPIPYKTKGYNIALGFSIVWGTNKKDKDDDKDGIYNSLDVCPATPANVAVDLLGCPIDSDGDGVPDYMDECPDTPQEAYGLINDKGCPSDHDGDGVPDYIDECPDTPKEAYGFVDEKGCNKDTDGDGVPDYMDECPDTPKEAYGQINENGCPTDSDGDGVPDYMDECPDTPKEAYGFVDDKGCPTDKDGDGIPDYLDQCPEQAGTRLNNGCPERKKEVRTILQEAMQGIQFENGKAVIKPVSYPVLDEVANVFKENPTFIIEVQGHTDNVGKSSANKRLSQSRADAVRKYLEKAGVEASRMTSVGYGDEKPIEDNKTAAGRAKNRRVEFAITYEQISYETVYDHADSAAIRQYQDSIQAIKMQQDSVAMPIEAETTENDN